MATSPTVALFNTDPNIQSQAALLQQRQALAQALVGEGMKPLDTSNRQIGGIAYRISPMEGLAKVLQSYVGQHMLRDTTTQQASLAAQAYGNLLSKYQPGDPTSFSPAQVAGANAAGMDGDGMGPPDPQKVAAYLTGQQPTQGSANPNNPQGIPAQILAAHDAGMINDKAFEVLTAPYKPTDATLAATQGGFSSTAANQQAFTKGQTDPKIWAMQQAGLTQQQIQAAIGGAAGKDAALPVKPGEPLYQFNGAGQPNLTAVAPNPSENLQFGVSPTGAVSASGVDGVPQARAALAGSTSGATAAAQAPHQIIELWDPKAQRTVKVYAGNVLPPASAGAQPAPAGGAPSTQIPPATQAARDAEALRIVKEERAKPSNSPQDNAALDREISRLQRVSAAAGASLGEGDQMKEMTTRFANLRAQNAEAQNTISYLQGIKQQAGKAAMGQFSDRMQFVNSLLSPFSEKAMDAATATQLLNKYSNQIVARLGQGGLGTDAARSILQSAYPNAHMTPGAAQEAADNLIGAQRMMMAKTNVLAPLHNSRDTAGYQQTEQKFDQLADPRIWQLQSMDANQAKAFLSKMPAAEQQSLRQRALELQKMGAL